MATPRRGGFRLGPIPHYSTTTRRGTHVSVGGCCLPLPLGCLTLVGMGAALGLPALARRRRAR